MAINLGNTTGAATSTTLEAWQIHDVKLKDCTYEIGKGKDSNGNEKPFYALDFIYGNESGDFRVRLFCPVNDAEGRKRHMNENDKYEQPSLEELFIFGVIHNISTGDSDPAKGGAVDRFKKMYAGNDPVTNESTFKAFCEKVRTLATKTIIEPSVELSLKLIGGKTNYARVQNIVGISKDKQAYIRTNYIVRKDGPVKLGYTANELASKAKYEQMASQSNASNIGGSDDLENTSVGAKPIDINTEDI